jgi:hypothetical protein
VFKIVYFTGIRKANVLPLPVFAAPKRSLPRSIIGEFPSFQSNSIAVDHDELKTIKAIH